ncbi:MAG TPA: hypothetical protein VGF17_08845 [Phytomonospora sp.]
MNTDATWSTHPWTPALADPTYRAEVHARLLSNIETTEAGDEGELWSDWSGEGFPEERPVLTHEQGPRSEHVGAIR